VTSPTVLLIEDQEWTARSIESILRPENFAVIKTYTGHQGLEVAKKIGPDLVLVDRHLPDMQGEDVIAQLKRFRSVGIVTPIAAITSGPLSQAERLTLLRAGAWDVFTSPFVPEDLSLRIRTWTTAKIEADRGRNASLVDELTGAYNFEGLSRRVREIGSEARRYQRPFACIVLGEPLPSAEPETSAGNENDVDQSVVKAIRDLCRVSDAVGRVRDREYIVVAPCTDEPGATILARRILDTLDELVTDTQLRAGVYSLKRSPREPLDLTDILGPATSALREAQKGKNRLSFQSNLAN